MIKEIRDYIKKVMKNYRLFLLFIPVLIIYIVAFFFDKTNNNANQVTFTPFQLFALYLIIIIAVILFIFLFTNLIINPIDCILLCSLITCALLYIYLILYNQLCFLKLSVFTILLILLILLRIILLSKEDANNEIDALVDFREIYENKVDLSLYNSCLAIEESDVKYDLLNRGFLINTIYKLIFQLETSKNYTIGLDGEWGTGKTTLVNNVLATAYNEGNLEKYLVVKFNPCVFEDDKKMLESFVTKILNKVDINLLDAKNIVDNVIEDFFNIDGSVISKIISTILNIISLSRHNELKDIIEETLNRKNKKLLIIIDDFDRIQPGSIVRLITFLNQVIEFDNTCIVILYDKEQINSIIKKEFGYEHDFLDKYVNFEYRVPSLYKDTTEKIMKAISNNLVFKDKPIFDFVDKLSIKFDSMREIKKFLNIILSNNLLIKNKINSSNYSILQYILLKNRDLYYEILDNKKYFIQFDNTRDFFFYYNQEEYEKERKAYFKKLLNKKEYSDYIQILIYLFPSIKKLLDEKEKYSTDVETYKYTDSVRNMKIDNKEFFDLYFNNYQSNYINIYNNVLEFIEKINEEKLSKNEIKQLIDKYESDDPKLFSEILFAFIEDIQEINCNELINCLYDKLKTVSYTIQWFDTSEENRILYMIAEIMIKHNIKFNRNTFVFDKFKDIYYIYEINDYYQHIYKNIIEYDNKYISYRDKFENFYKKCCKNILTSSKNLFDDKYYSYRNLRAIYHYNVKEENMYVRKKINSSNVLNILRELVDIGQSFDGTYEYSIRKETLEKFAPNVPFNRYISNIDYPLSDNEKNILNIYNNLKKKSSSNYFGKIFIDFRIK